MITQSQPTPFSCSFARLNLLLIAVLSAALLAPSAAAADPPSRIELATDSTGRSLVTIASEEFGKFRMRLVRLDEAGHVDPSLDGDGVFAPRVRSGVVAWQPDGKILLTGTADFRKQSDLRKRGLRRRYYLHRYLPSGRLDPTFGIGGRVRIPGYAVKRLFVQPNGDIVILGGEIYLPGHLVVERFSSTGRLLSRKVPYHDWTFEAADMEPSGEIVISGFEDCCEETTLVETFARLTPSGRIDSILGGPKGLTIDRGEGPLDDVEALAALPDSSFVFLSHGEFRTIQRRTSDGTLDTSFGENGATHCDHEPSSKAFERVIRMSLEALPDGSFLAVGGQGACGLVKYLPNGMPDTSFGAAGSVNLRAERRFTPLVAANGSQGTIVVAGWDDVSRTVKVARLLPDGSLDANFGSSGVFSFRVLRRTRAAN
jgi:uncharacterized delta-60 repeat protein